MLVLDLDDTLLDKNQSLSDKTIETLNRLERKGLKIVIATGRMYCSALPKIDQIGLKGPMVTYNGAYVRDNGQDKVILHKPIEQEIAEKIIKEAEEEGLHINLYLDDNLYVAEKNKYSELYQSISGIEAEAVGVVSNFILGSPTKLLIITDDIEIKRKYLSKFKDKYGDILEITESKDYFIEFMAKGVSKGSAVKNIADDFGIPMEKVIAIGDNWNDLEMIQQAGLGIAMENSPAGVKKEADMTAPHHDQEGVSEILHEIFNLSD